MSNALVFKISADMSQFRTALQNTQKSLNKVGKKMQKVGKTMSVGLTAPIAAFGAMAIRTAGNFEKSMNRVGALSGATGKELEGLTNLAREMGATTQYSASEAADALGFLSMAGLDVSEQMVALPNVLNLAAAASIDLATAADITSNIMSGYGKNATDLAQINDVLAATFTSTNTNLSQLGESFTYVGPLASALKIPIEQTSAAIGLLGNAGIQGSMAGTVLKGALTNMIKPTDAMSATMAKLGIEINETIINQEGLIGVIKRVEESGASAADIMQLFGKIAGPGMTSLISQGSDSLVKLTGELKNSGGTAEEIANKQMEGFNGAMLKLKSAFEELQIAIASSGLLDMFTGLAEKLTGLIGWISKLNPSLLKIITIFAGIAAAVGPIILALGYLAPALGTIAAAVAAINAPILLIIGSIAALIAAGIYLYDNWEAVTDFLSNSWVTIKNSFLDGVIKVIKTLTSLHVAISKALGIDMVKDSVDFITNKLEGMKSPVQETATEFKSFGETVSSLKEEMIPDMQAVETEVVSSMDEMDKSATKTGNSIGALQKRINEFPAIPAMTTQSINDVAGAMTYAGQVSDEIVPRMTEQTRTLDQVIGEWGIEALNVGQAVSSAMQNAATNVAVSFAEMIASAAMGGAGFQDFGKMILGAIAGFMQDFGKALITMSAGMIAVQTLAANPFAALAAGVALVAGGIILQNVMSKGPEIENVPAFANGGLVFGPTMGLIGEGSGTTPSNPEVIAPLDKLKQFIGGGDQVNGTVTLEGKISGRDIYLSSKLGAEATSNLIG